MNYSPPSPPNYIGRTTAEKLHIISHPKKRGFAPSPSPTSPGGDLPESVHPKKDTDGLEWPELDLEWPELDLEWPTLDLEWPSLDLD